MLYIMVYRSNRWLIILSHRVRIIGHITIFLLFSFKIIILIIHIFIVFSFIRFIIFRIIWMSSARTSIINYSNLRYFTSLPRWFTWIDGILRRLSSFIVALCVQMVLISRWIMVHLTSMWMYKRYRAQITLFKLVLIMMRLSSTIKLFLAIGLAFSRNTWWFFGLCMIFVWWDTTSWIYERSSWRHVTTSSTITIRRITSSTSFINYWDSIILILFCSSK